MMANENSPISDPAGDDPDFSKNENQRKAMSYPDNDDCRPEHKKHRLSRTKTGDQREVGMGEPSKLPAPVSECAHCGQGVRRGLVNVPFPYTDGKDFYCSALCCNLGEAKPTAPPPVEREVRRCIRCGRTEGLKRFHNGLWYCDAIPSLCVPPNSVHCGHCGSRCSMERERSGYCSSLCADRARRGEPQIPGGYAKRNEPKMTGHASGKAHETHRCDHCGDFDRLKYYLGAGQWACSDKSACLEDCQERMEDNVHCEGEKLLPAPDSTTPAFFLAPCDWCEAPVGKKPFRDDAGKLYCSEVCGEIANSEAVAAGLVKPPGLIQVSENHKIVLRSLLWALSQEVAAYLDRGYPNDTLGLGVFTAARELTEAVTSELLFRGKLPYERPDGADGGEPVHYAEEQLDALYSKIPNSMLHRFVSDDGATIRANAYGVDFAGALEMMREGKTVGQEDDPEDNRLWIHHLGWKDEKIVYSEYPHGAPKSPAFGIPSECVLATNWIEVEPVPGAQPNPKEKPNGYRARSLFFVELRESWAKKIKELKERVVKRKKHGAPGFLVDTRPRKLSVASAQEFGMELARLREAQLESFAIAANAALDIDTLDEFVMPVANCHPDGLTIYVVPGYDHALKEVVCYSPGSVTFEEIKWPIDGGQGVNGNA